MLTYAILLLIAGIVLIAAEAFIPSGGLLGVLAGIAFIASLILAFQENPATGFLFLAIAAVCVPTTVILGLNLFPKTPIGKRLILKPADSTSARQSQSNASVAEQDFSQLLNKTGKTVTPLRPSGAVEIDDQRYSAVADGDMIDDNVEIVVIKVEGNSIVVEPKNS